MQPVTYNVNINCLYALELWLKGEFQIVCILQILYNGQLCIVYILQSLKKKKKNTVPVLELISQQEFIKEIFNKAARTCHSTINARAL